MRECILHLGMNKTGSTTIQYSLRGYDSGSFRYFPFHRPDHTELLIPGFSRMKQASVIAERLSKDLDSARESARRLLTKRLDADDRNIILSSEWLSTFPLESEVQDLYDFLKPKFDRMKVIGYVRDPRSFIPSAFQQKLKHHKGDFEIAKIFPKFKDRLSIWVNVFGVDNVELVSFDRNCLYQGDVLADFCNRVGIEKPEVQLEDGQKNISLSAEATAVLFLYRYRKGALIALPPKMQSSNDLMLSRLRSFGTGSFGFTASVLDPIFARHSNQIDWVQRHMIGPLMPSKPDPDVLFGNTEEIVAYAESCLPLFKLWFKENFEHRGPEPEDVIGIIDALYQKIKTRPAPTIEPDVVPGVVIETDHAPAPAKRPVRQQPGLNALVNWWKRSRAR